MLKEPGTAPSRSARKADASRRSFKEKDSLGSILPRGEIPEDLA
jgi:hypothetical protein